MRVYWNNICLISRLEKQYLEEKLRQHQLEEIYKFEFFGLGKETELITKIQQDLRIKNIPDVIISTNFDLLFGQEAFLNKEDLLDNYEPWEFKNDIRQVSPIEKFRPILYIPLVMIANKEKVSDIPNSIMEILNDDNYKDEITFGGFTNSAGKTLLATVEDLYGYEKRKRLVEWSNITNMPVGAFKNVVDGKSKIGFVPTIFAMRESISEIKMIWPEEGAIVIPSYLLIKRGANKNELKQLFEKVIDLELLDRISKQTGIIPCVKGVETIENFRQNENNIIYPSREFFKNRQEKVMN